MTIEEARAILDNPKTNEDFLKDYKNFFKSQKLSNKKMKKIYKNSFP